MCVYVCRGLILLKVWENNVLGLKFDWVCDVDYCCC